MVTNIWVRYLPVLRTVLERSLVAEQRLALKAVDFGRAGLSPKVGYKFLLKLKEGELRNENEIADMPVASALANTLLNDKRVKLLLSGHEFHVSLNTKYELTVKHIPQYVPHGQAAAGVATAAV